MIPTGAKELQQALDDAEARAISASRIDGARGVLITRINARLYTVELSEDVPFGMTLERHA